MITPSKKDNIKKIESVLKKPAPYPVPDTTITSPIKKTVAKTASTANFNH